MSEKVKLNTLFENLSQIEKALYTNNYINFSKFSRYFFDKNNGFGSFLRTYI